jgi:hypothetical protein
LFGVGLLEPALAPLADHLQEPILVEVAFLDDRLDLALQAILVVGRDVLRGVDDARDVGGLRRLAADTGLLRPPG